MAATAGRDSRGRLDASQVTMGRTCSGLYLSVRFYVCAATSIRISFVYDVHRVFIFLVCISVYRFCLGLST